MRAVPRVAVSSAGCVLALLCVACGSTRAAAKPAAVVIATGTLVGGAGVCVGRPAIPGVPPPHSKVLVTLRKGSVVVAAVHVTDVGEHNQPFTFKEPAGDYTVFTSAGAKQHVMITVGETTRVELASPQACS